MGSMHRRNAVVAGLFLLALLCTGALAQTTAPGAAKTYPVKPIRLVVPFPAGASSDVVGLFAASNAARTSAEASSF